MHLVRDDASKVECWQRIGHRFVGARFRWSWVYAWVFEARHREHFYQWRLSMCDATLQIENASLQHIGKEEDRDQRESAIQADHERCKGQAGADLHELYDASFSQMLAYISC